MGVRKERFGAKATGPIYGGHLASRTHSITQRAFGFEGFLPGTSKVADAPPRLGQCPPPLLPFAQKATPRKPKRAARQWHAFDALIRFQAPELLVFFALGHAFSPNHSPNPRVLRGHRPSPPLSLNLAGRNS